MLKLPTRLHTHNRPAWAAALLGVLVAALFIAVWFPVRAAAPLALARVKVEVPAGMNAAPFNQDRYLNVPPNVSVAVFARVSNARFLAIAPNGDLLVSQPNENKVTLLRPGQSAPQAFTFATGMSKPHDIVFHSYNNQTYVFIAAEDAIYRFAYTTGATQAGARSTVVKNLPNGSSGELKGQYGHTLKNIAIDSTNMLYVSIASATNDNPSDLAATPKRGAVYTYDATKAEQEATSGALFATGLRNAEGLAFVPGTNDLWVAVNNRDNIAYPFRSDFDGDGSDDYGKVMSGYVDNHPPEEFTRVMQNGNYGWPFCNPNPDNGMDTMPYDRDVRNNPNNDKLDCTKANPISKGIQAHSAPLGLTFTANTAAPLAFNNGVIIGLHGSWNRTQKTGYKFVYFPWNSATNAPGIEADFVTGWLEGSSAWGRPVDSAVAPDGSIYLSDDSSGTIYRLVSNASAYETHLPLLGR